MTKQISKTKITEKNESKTYQSMLNELDEIVRAVSQGELDLDEVVSKVEHGYELIGTMRQRLDQTRARVEAMRVDFEKSTSAEKPHKKTAQTKSSPEDVTDQSSPSSDDDDDLPF